MKGSTPVAQAPRIDIGIKEKHRAAIAEGLSKMLADTYTLYLKTHNFHWNVTGPMFTTLHTLFEQEYTELALAVDEIAERIRALGAPAPGSYVDFSRLTALKEAEGVPPAAEMLRQLVHDQVLLGQAAQAVIKASERAGDDATADLGVRRMQVHEKNAWMLRSHLEA
jgi:starvation-inducible DNA-binding protein